MCRFNAEILNTPDKQPVTGIYQITAEDPYGFTIPRHQQCERGLTKDQVRTTIVET
jgi:hypothetical protein